jgi:hypothetical protein
MVGPAFPRPLYPPDAKPGHTPSGDGPDVIAVKRSIWRGGRWPGPASNFDDSYSNGFSHGKTGGNVGDSGTAGFQRQMKIQPTGWIGTETANAIRSARIPDGLPNAGEPLMDQTAIDLMEKAVKQFSEGSGKKVRDQALAKAKNQIGVKESPYGSNEVKYSDWYGMIGPWCAMFCTWCFELAAQDLGKDSPSFVRGSYYAYVPYIVSDARNGRRGLSVPSEVKPGDLVCYNWDGGPSGEFDHIGIFEKWTGGRTFTAIEGNTSVDNNSNGGEVMRRTRDAGSTTVQFVRVAEP